VHRRARGVAPAAGAGRAGQELGPLGIDRRSRRVWLAGGELELTPREFDLLADLAEEPGQVRRREDIIARVWDEHWWGPTKTLDVHVAALRRKLGRPGDHEWITTLRGVGYRLDPPG
jgi:two-component system response regulator RegX3